MCLECPANSFQNSEGQRTCVCNAGYVGVEGLTCAVCDEGKFIPASNGNEITNFWKCNDCPSNAGSSVKGSTSIASCSCNAGYEKSSGATNSYFWCEQCDRGKYKDSRGDGPCASCPSNTESVSGSTSATSCTTVTPVIKPKCAPNTYSTDCTPTTSGSQSQGVCKTLMVVGLVVGIVFIS